MAPLESKHILFAPHPMAWGHIRPVLVLAVRLVLEREDIVVTVITAPVMLEKAFSDLATQLPGAPLEQARQRIRVISPMSIRDLATKGENDMFKMLEFVVESYPVTYKTLLESKPIKCEETGTTFDAVAPPSLVVADFFGLGQTLATRAATGKTVPILMFIASSAAATTMCVGPEEHGGFGDLASKIDAEAARTGRPAIEVGEEFFNNFTGKVLNVAGLPPMYDYEFSPQLLPFNAPLSAMLRLCYPTLKECDGMLITTFEKWENRGSFQVLKSWMADWGKDTYGIGPLLPLGYGSGAVSNRGATDVEAFLQNKLDKHGKKSVLFISFGTVFWPTKPEYIDELVDSLIDKNMPFIFCHASPFGNVSEDLVKKVEASGIGFITKWAPQQYVLNHPATGWFLTHGGHGSTSEGIGSGIPMVFWPFTGDQPIGSAILEAHGAAVELLEVRTGPHATRPIRRVGRAPAGTRAEVGAEIRGVLDALRGGVGAEMARAAGRLGREFAASWEDGGDGRSAFRAFLGKYLQ